jgi:ABC-type sugar transport system substrate-binding protein
VRGIRDGILEAAPGARILGDWLGFSRENGYATVSRLIEQGVTFDVIASMNDAGSIGAIDALEEAGYARDSIPIVSANAESAALDLMREERFIRGSVSVNREEGSQLALYAIIQQLAGATVPEILSFPPGEMVTRETLIASAGEVTPEAPAPIASE